jgi:hypothetical protein
VLSKRKPPVNLKPADAKFFEHEFERSFPDHFLTHYHEVIVTPDGVVLANGKVEPESLYSDAHKVFFNGLYRIYYNSFGFFKGIGKGPYLLAFDAWSFGYFHWMTEFIPRLFKIKNLIAECTVILPTINNGIWNTASALRSLYRNGQIIAEGGYFIESLEAFHLESVYKHCLKTPLKTTNLYFSSHLAQSGNYDDQTMRGLRDFYFNHYEITKEEEPYRFVYVSRNLAARRHVQNEDEIIESISPLGFELFSFENLSFREQIILLSQTKFLICQHGAALTNLLFMKENSFALELKAEGDSQNLCYFSLAGAMNINYLYQFCQSDGRTVQDANIIVNATTLKENIKLVLNP